MAGLPSAPNESALDKLDPLRIYVVEALSLGLTLPQMAKRLEPDDPKKRKQLRAQFRKLTRSDKRFHEMVASAARGEMVAGLIPATQALAKRAARGRPDAIKLLYEASGFHNPRVQHEHTGDIKVTLDIPRPERLSVDPEEVTDAEVVDD